MCELQTGAIKIYTVKAIDKFIVNFTKKCDLKKQNDKVRYIRIFLNPIKIAFIKYKFISYDFLSQLI